MLASLYTNAHKKEGSPAAKLSDFFYMDPTALSEKKEQESLQNTQNFAEFLEQKVKQQKVKQQNGNWPG